MIKFLYTNYRGEKAIRRVIPIHVSFKSTPFHEEQQWILTAWDLDKQAQRDFALKDCDFTHADVGHYQPGPPTGVPFQTDYQWPPYFQSTKVQSNEMDPLEHLHHIATQEREGVVFSVSFTGAHWVIIWGDEGKIFTKKADTLEEVYDQVIGELY